MDVDARLAALGLTLPDAPAPAANYVPFVRAGNLLHVSGQVCQDRDGQFLTGKCGDTVTTERRLQPVRRGARLACWRRSVPRAMVIGQSSTGR